MSPTSTMTRWNSPTARSSCSPIWWPDKELLCCNSLQIQSRKSTRRLTRQNLQQRNVILLRFSCPAHASLGGYIRRVAYNGIEHLPSSGREVRFDAICE